MHTTELSQNLKNDMETAVEPNQDEPGYCTDDEASPMSSRVVKYKDEGSQSPPRKIPKVEYSEDAIPCKTRNMVGNIIKVSYKNVKYSWETNGNESISDWVQINLLEISSKDASDMDKLSFRNCVSGAIINSGWNTSILKKEENYMIKFCRPKNAKQSMHRKDFPDSIDFSKVKSIRIKNKGLAISHLYRIPDIEFLQVNFLPRESLYEALYRDGRFDNTKLQNYDLQLPKEEDRTVPLSISADNYAGHDFKFSKRSQPNATLQVKPYKGNQQTEKPADSIEIKSEPSEPPVKAGTSGVFVKEEIYEENEESSFETTISSDQELLNFIEEFMLKLKINPKNEKKVVKILDTLFKSSYNNYALKENRQLYTADHEVIVNVCKSVGAVVVKYTSGEEAFKGTCFRIGAKFVLTNCHVVKLILNELHLVERIWIDFDHGEPDPPSHRAFPCLPTGNPVFDEVLDYAVLSLDVQDGQELPPSLTGPGMLGPPRYSQNLEEGRMLTFVGHPGGDKTATNVCCPVSNPGNLANEYAITLSQHEWLNKDCMETYDVSTFFHGSSGSPGFLVKERMLIVMHTRGICLNRQSGRSIEQGVMMYAIMSDIWNKLEAASNSNIYQELFGI